MPISLITSVKRAHVVLFAYEAWGHTRPLCNLAVRLAKTRPAIITLFTTHVFYDRVKRELRRSVQSADGPLLDDIRVIALHNTGRHALDNKVLDESFAEAYEQLVNGEPVKCAHTGHCVEAVSSPDAVIIDFYGRPLLEAVRRLSQKPVKVFVWFAGAASVIFRFYGPADKGGAGNLRAKAEQEAARSGITVEAATAEILFKCEKSLLKIPGLPAMYDHEFQPQTLLGGYAMLGGMFLSAYDMFAACDGVILATSDCYEPETTAALKKHFAQTSRSVHLCGPMIPCGAQARALEGEQCRDTVEIEDFLESTLSSHGERSVLYVCGIFSLGTVYWPSEPEKVWAFLDVLVEMRIPFTTMQIMSHAVRYAAVPNSVVQKINNYGHGLLTTWSPQQLVLSHSATGWFVTHGGHNSVIEAVSAGVPICSKLGMDRHSTGKAPTGTVEAFCLEAKDILKKAFGEDGMHKRNNVLKLKQKTEEAWSKAGASRRTIESFMNSVI
ncbi:glycosyltransferase family 1 protein [Postia placenta MAD-698-R-SB12]|uniref:Glycosyltransferase family 1 protein n=1 Tax=Postia placenta MAD-698-R-SB12 TaxID=670580 RepID=A0A1X6N786_9APHY|nr:glycosyltransferase family 1 protein [Postia placenta MAD-698-R-SB12]OSX64471.1 glycosyltransferase family 1 protein [Postia placenta MAD-698-R-SB12]